MTSPRTGATATSKDGLDLCRAYFFRVCRKEIKEALLAGCIKITYQCKIIIVPEEGWFGQPKYSTHKKYPSTLCRLLLLFSSFYM